MRLRQNAVEDRKWEKSMSDRAKYECKTLKINQLSHQKILPFI